MPRRAVVPLFGRPAADPNAFEVLRSCVTKLASNRRTPQLFKVRVDGLELQGLADGLAREFTSTGEVDLNHTNVHAVAGLLKLWLRKLPAPALTFELYSEWTSELNVPTLATSDDVLAQNLRKVAAKLPSGHFEECVLLFALHHAVDGHRACRGPFWQFDAGIPRGIDFLRTPISLKIGRQHTHGRMQHGVRVALPLIDHRV